MQKDITLRLPPQKAFDSKAFFKNPEILMPVMDDTLKSGNYSREEEK